MEPFSLGERPTAFFSGSERFLAFVQAVRDALVPPTGACTSVQGELVRANDKLTYELLHNGLGNYYREDQALEANYYGELMLFMLGTLTENRNGALSPDEVAFFAQMRQRLPADRELALLEGRTEEGEEEPTETELQRLEELQASHASVPWEELLDRAQGCIANWCIANPELIDRHGRSVVERGVSNLEHIFNPPPAPPPCPLCHGRGFIPQVKESDFPELCSCKGGRPQT